MNNFDLKNVKAIIGLGNPGSKYSRNRHNIGFRVVDAIADKFDASWQERDDLQYCDIQIMSSIFSEDTESRVNRGIEVVSKDDEIQKLILIKPQTFMNTSGSIIPFLLKKGIKPDEILVVHDELEKPFGKIIVKLGGSARGHNGLRSIIGVIGPEFWRLRFGIGRPERKEDVSNYVLSNFIPEEESQIDSLIDQAINQII